MTRQAPSSPSRAAQTKGRRDLGTFQSPPLRGLPPFQTKVLEPCVELGRPPLARFFLLWSSCLDGVASTRPAQLVFNFFEHLLAGLMDLYDGAQDPKYNTPAAASPCSGRGCVLICKVLQPPHFTLAQIRRLNFDPMPFVPAMTVLFGCSTFCHCQWLLTCSPSLHHPNLLPSFAHTTCRGTNTISTRTSFLCEACAGRETAERIR